MQRTTRGIAGILMVVITTLQHQVIFSSIGSIVCFIFLVAVHPRSIADYWNISLGEYWLAGITWIVMASWLVWPRALGNWSRKKARSVLTSSQRCTAYVFGILACVALTSPFLVPVDPNAQGTLVTTRLLPPLSAGYVRESWDDGISARETDGAIARTYWRARGFLLNRSVSISGRVGQASPLSVLEGSADVREFPVLFLFGTDDNARDVFSRVLSGTRISLGVGLLAACASVVIGALIGFVAGMYGGAIDALLMRLTDLFLAIPSLFLVIAMLAFIGQSVPALVLVLAVSGWMGVARVVRGEVVSLREREFVLAARLLQLSPWRIIWRHILPNIRGVILTAAVLQFANAVLGEAALGFLGLGIQPPTASWGNMMGEATGYVSSAWWVGVFPGMVLAAVMVSAHTLGESMEV